MIDRFHWRFLNFRMIDWNRDYGKMKMMKVNPNIHTTLKLTNLFYVFIWWLYFTIVSDRRTNWWPKFSLSVATIAVTSDCHGISGQKT